MQLAIVVGMSPGLVLSAIAALVLLVTSIGALFWWARRPMPLPRVEHAPLPLFSHAQAAVWMREDDEDEEESPEPVTARAVGADRKGQRGGSGVARGSDARERGPDREV